jgi:four helix bundle protein
LRKGDGVAEIVPGYRRLVAWQKALDLADRVYDVTEEWPAREMYGLCSQVRRAAASVPANIAEGQGRGSPGDFGRFLDFAYGSLCELETHLALAQRRHFVARAEFDAVLADSDEVARLIRGLQKTVRSRASLREASPTYDHASDDDAEAETTE